jgi:hypothetical protein
MYPSICSFCNSKAMRISVYSATIFGSAYLSFEHDCFGTPWLLFCCPCLSRLRHHPRTVARRNAAQEEGSHCWQFLLLVPGIDGSLEAANAADLLIVLILTGNGRVECFAPSDLLLSILNLQRKYIMIVFFNKQPDRLVWYGDSVNKELLVQLLFYRTT